LRTARLDKASPPPTRPRPEACISSSHPVGSANRQTGVPYFDSKLKVEKYIAKIDVRATILAPVYFVENLYFARGQLANGIYPSALSPTRALAQVAVANIGAVAARVLENAGRFTGKRLDLAGDELTGNDVVGILSRVTGRPFSYYQVPLDVVRQRMGEDGARMYEWLDRVGYTADRAALRREFPDVAFHDFESWAKTQDWNAFLQSAQHEHRMSSVLPFSQLRSWRSI
jgi:uncharacterized protein YbjT (DUF2867 family)